MVAPFKPVNFDKLPEVFRDPDGREPGRTVELHLTGHMERFAWSFDGVKFADAELLGVPLLVVVGRGLADGVVEVRPRAGEAEQLAVADAVASVAARVAELLAD